MKNRTPVADQAQKIDIIEHINDDHQAELCAIITDQVADVEQAKPHIEDIFEEGVLVVVTQGEQHQSIFVPFQLKGDLEEKILYLAYSAMAKQGKPLGGNKKRYFEVLETQTLTQNMLRLVLKSDVPLPENAPGFAYLFAQRVLQKAPKAMQKSIASGEEKRLGFLGIWFSRAFLWVMKHLSRKQRQRVLASMNKGLRYYTLQSAHRSDSGNGFADIAWVDVFLHGDTAGSVWAKNLQAGDIVVSNAEYEEQTEHLQKGQALLVADETSLPTLLALLAQWENPQPPVVIILTAQHSEQDYLPDAALPTGSRCRRLVGKQSALLEALTAYLEKLETIDAAWGGLEKDTAKLLRSHLRQTRQLSGKSNRIKAYWVDKP